MHKLDLIDVVENEGGDTTYTFKVDEETSVFMAELGMKLILHCAITGVDLEEVFDYILSKDKVETNEHG